MFETLFQKYPFFRKIPAILCMAIIFKISSMTSADLEGLPHVWDKLAHTCEYATLAGCFALWWERAKWSSRQCIRVLIVAVLALVYGCTDEFHQSFVEGRDSSVLDLVADLVGGLIGGTVYAVVCLILNRFDPLPAENSATKVCVENEDENAESEFQENKKASAETDAENK